MAYLSDCESDLTDDEDQAALKLNAWLVNWEKSLLEEHLRLREEMEGQVNSGNGWLSDYEFDLDVSFYVRDDDPCSPINYPDSEHDVDRDASMLCSSDFLFFILKGTGRLPDYWGVGDDRDHNDWHGSCRKGSIYEAKHCTTFHELCSHIGIPMKHMGRIGRICTDITIFRQNFADVPKDGKEGISISHKSHKFRPRKQHAKSIIFFGHLLLALRRPQRLAIFRLECVLRDLSICDKAALVHICALVVAAAQVVP